MAAGLDAETIRLSKFVKTVYKQGSKMQIKVYLSAIARYLLCLGLLPLGLSFSAMVHAQATVASNPANVDHWTQAELLESAKALEATSHSSDGSASLKLTDYSNHSTMMSLRKKSGGAEIHENFADFFLVIEGHATLVTGGTILHAQAAGNGEIRGVAVDGGTSQTLNKGDLVHIPAGVPHQIQLSDDGPFVYFVIKVKEK